MNAPADLVITRCFKVNRRDLVYLKFILEAYEGLTTMSTVEKDPCIVMISYATNRLEDAGKLLEEVGREIALVEMPDSYDYRLAKRSGDARQL